MFIGIPYLTPLTEFIAAAGLNTLCQEILQSKNPLNRRAIKQIMRADSGGGSGGAGTFVTGSSQYARPAKTRATIIDLARVVNEQQAEIQGIKNW